MTRPRWPLGPGRRSSDRDPSQPCGLMVVARSRSALHRTRMVEGTEGSHHKEGSRLRHDGFMVIVFQPAQVRAYANFHLQRAKNDKIDAALIAACTTATKKIHAPPDPRLAPFAEHLTLIEQ